MDVDCFLLFIYLYVLHIGNTVESGVSRVQPFCNLQSQARSHAVLVIGLYELLDNPTT
jgi:hypothetical protein